MAAMKKQKTLLKKLKKQVRALQRKENQAKNQLRSAVKKMRKLGRGFQTKLSRKVRMMQGRIAEAQASSYAKAAADIERQLQKGVEAKATALRNVLRKLEKKNIIKLKKSLSKKGKKPGKAKSSKSASSKMKLAKRSARKSRSRRGK